MKKLMLTSVAGLLWVSFAAAQAVGPVQITSLTTATGYEAHEPVDATQTFTTRDRIYVAIVASNSGEASEIRVSFERVGSSSAGEPRGVLLNVPHCRRYRTVARTAGLPAGQYRAVVRDGSGATLSEAQFTVTE